MNSTDANKINKYDELKNNYCDGDNHLQLNSFIEYINLKQNFEKGKVILIDSKYGMGKTYFSNMIEAAFEEKELNTDLIFFKLDLKLINQFDPSLVLFLLLNNMQIQFGSLLTNSEKRIIRTSFKALTKILYQAVPGLSDIISGEATENSKELISNIYRFKTIDGKGIFTNNDDYNKFQTRLLKYQKDMQDLFKKKDKSYLILFLNNIDSCNEKFVYDVLTLINSYFRDINIPYGIFLLGDYGSIENTFKDNRKYQEDAYNQLTSIIRKIFTLPLPDYKKAINSFIKKDEKGNDYLEKDAIETLKNICDQYKPKLSSLKRMMEGLMDYIDMHQDFNKYDQMIVRNILLLTSLKYFEYNKFRNIRENIEDIGLKDINEFLYNFIKNDYELKPDSIHKLYKKLDDDKYISNNILLEEEDKFEIKKIQNKEYLQINKKDIERPILYYIDKSSSIDHVIPYECLDHLESFFNKDIISIYSLFYGII